MQGLCGAGSAINDSSVVYTNPSVLSIVRHSEVNIFQGTMLGGVNYLSLGVSSTQEFLGFTGALQYVNASLDGFKEAYLTNGEVGLTGRQFGYNAHNYVFSLAHHLSDQLLVGTNLKYITESLDDKAASGYGADFGLTYIYNPTVQFSCTLRNALTPQLKWNTDDAAVESASKKLTFGVAYFGYKDLALVSDVYTTESQKLGVSTGVEYYLNKYFAMRCGTDFSRFSLGSSLYFDQASLHFAFAPDFDGVIGNAYYFSGTYSFDQSQTQQATPAFVPVSAVAPVSVEPTPAPVEVPAAAVPVSPSVVPVEIRPRSTKPVDDGLSTIYIYSDKKTDSQNIWITK